MHQDKSAEPSDETRLAEIAYHKKQNRLVIYATLPSMFSYAGLYFYLSNYFQLFIFFLMITNSITGLIVGNRFTDIRNLTIYKRSAGVIWFALLAINLLTGLWDEQIYYIVMPWIFLYPMAAVMFLGRRLGFIIGSVFTILALIFFGINEMPPLNGLNMVMFQVNAVFTLLSILLMSVIYEKIRMKVQDNLAISENQYRLAEQRQRETNVNLQQEIDRRKHSEKALAESELHYRALFEESVVPLWEEDWSQVKSLLDALPQKSLNNLPEYFNENPREIEKYVPFMRVKAVNRATLKLYDTQSQSTLLKNLSCIVSDESHDFVVRQMVSLYQTGRYDAEIDGLTLTGKKLHLLVSSTIPAGYEASWQKIFSSVYDVTERMQMEQEKIRVERQMQNARQIQAIATLAGGIAHQFNNALAVIYGSLDLLEINTQGAGKNREFLASLKASAGHMSRLTDQLLAYAEGGKYQPRPFSVNDLINDIVNSHATPQESAIQIITDLSRDMLTTTGDITQIKMVVDVVLSNSFEALQQGGFVKITTGRRLFGETGKKNDEPAKPGDYIFISIEDNGAGMKEEIIQRIFEPFFTTKIHGRGLGMAAAFGIVRNHDGMITVDSEPGKGTKVVIYVPSTESQEDEIKTLQ